jgi:diguanylate cyclase (GGDEF)-like protein
LSGILDEPTTRRRFYLAGAAIALIVLTVLIILPNGGRRLPVVAPFLPMFAVTIILVEGLTGYFLAIQYQGTKLAYLGGLAGAYGYVMVTVVLQILVFPGVFSPTGLFGATPQSAVWLWVFWHAGFPLLLLPAALTRTEIAARVLGWRLPYVGFGLMVAGPMLAALVGYLAIAHAEQLPPLIKAGSYLGLRDSFAAKLLIGSIAAALVAIIWVTRLRDLLSLWVAVSLVAGLGDVLLVLTAIQRFSLGWYAGRMLSMVASSVVLVVLIYESTQLYRRLLKANAILAARAMHDGLTGALNRSYFIEQFPREFRLAVRERAPLSLLMIDVDHFKAYNDACGHQMGDQCLIRIVAAIETVMRRPADFVARYGGEEFVVVLPRTDAAGASRQAELVCQAVRALQLPRLDAIGRFVTVSVGVATLSLTTDAFQPENLIQRADAALYQAKRSGRDRTVVFGSFGADGLRVA